MDIHPAHDLQRVHMRALGRLHQLHIEISSGRCPSIQDLAVSMGKTHLATA
jgi:hypothetical protein